MSQRYRNYPKFLTDRSRQTVLTQIRLLLNEQSAEGQHCLPFCLHLLDTLLYGKTTMFIFYDNYRNFLEYFNFSVPRVLIGFISLFPSRLAWSVGSNSLYNLSSDLVCTLAVHWWICLQLIYYTDRVKRIWYLSPMRAAKAQASLGIHCSLIQAVSQEEPSNRKPDPWPLWMAGHAQLKFVMTECSKTQIRLTGPIQ